MAKNSDSASKYKDIISNSSKIQAGSPDVYQLKPKKEMIGTLTRKTVGDRNPDKINKTILLVGETGTGKSTLINTLVNYTMGVTFEDDIWFEIVERENICQSESQTSDVIVYEIFGFEDETLPYSLTIIDTPGYGDTRGIEQDKNVSERLIDLFRTDEGIHEINAVGLVMKASENRLSDRMRYIFDSVVSLFGKDLEEKIVALITFSNGITPKNVLKALQAANIKCAKKDNQPLHFQFDNCQDENRADDREDLAHADKITMKGLIQFTDFLKDTTPQKLEQTVDVLNERRRLTASIQNLQERIELIEGKQREIEQIQEAVKKHEQQMKTYETFTVEVDEIYKVRETIHSGAWGLRLFYDGAVCCNVCEETCHYPGCTMTWSPEHCEVMKNGNCTVCSAKCPVSVHVKEKSRYVTRTRKVTKTLRDVMCAFNKDTSESKLSLLENLENKMKDLTAEKNQLVDESYQHIVKLDQIALNVNSLSTYVHLDFLIEKMKEKEDTEKVQKLEEMRSRLDEGTRAGLKYMFGKAPAAGKTVHEVK